MSKSGSKSSGKGSGPGPGVEEFTDAHEKKYLEFFRYVMKKKVSLHAAAESASAVLIRCCICTALHTACLSTAHCMPQHCTLHASALLSLHASAESASALLTPCVLLCTGVHRC